MHIVGQSQGQPFLRLRHIVLTAILERQMRTIQRVVIGLTVAAAAFTGARTSQARQQPRIPDRIADSTYWRMITEFSEPSGYFLSENFVSNETELQTIIAGALNSFRPTDAYLGVGPEQNFTYIAALKPRIAFITDIRRQNLLQHLMYKAIFELSADRADFLARLFSRARPTGLDSTSTPAAFVAAFSAATPDSARHATNVAAMFDVLVNRHKFTLSADDSARLRAVYGVFNTMGLDISYSSTSRMRREPSWPPGTRMTPNGPFTFTVTLAVDSAGRTVMRTDSIRQALPDSLAPMQVFTRVLGGGFATFASLLTVDDGAGLNRGWLANETNYRWLRDFQQRNLLVPVVGDFAGPKALRSIGTYLRERATRVGAFYTSNVEQYLFQNDVDSLFYANVATLPTDSTSLFLRSFPNMFRSIIPQRQPGPRLTQTYSPIHAILSAYRAGQIRTYNDLAGLARP
jgi:hypothetical protein